MKINTRKRLKVAAGTIRFRRFDGPMARALGIDFGATLCRGCGGGIAEAERVNGVWVAGSQISASERRDLGYRSGELVEILNTMESGAVI